MKKFGLILLMSLITVMVFSSTLHGKKDSFAGNWTGSTYTPDGMEMGLTLTFKSENGKLSGTISDDVGMLGESELKDLKVDGKKLNCYFDFYGPDGETRIMIKLIIDGDKMEGTWEMEIDGSTGEFNFKRD